MSHFYVHAYPNAGLPNAMGGYDETAENFAENVSAFCDDGLVNMVGGCCGTTPDYIQALWNKVKGMAPRIPTEKSNLMMLSGMSSFIFRDIIPFVNIGERCNISGSAKFKKLVKADNWDTAVSIAKD